MWKSVCCNTNALLDLMKWDVIRVQLTDRDTSFECHPCKLTKPKRAPVNSIHEGERGQAFGDEIHSDIWGPAKLESFGKRMYFVSYTDNWSHWTTCYLLFSKGDVFSTYKLFAAWVSTHMGINIKCLHSNCGGKYMSDVFITYLDEQRTARKLTVHDTPEENGVAERLNRTLMEQVRAMVIASGMPHKSWGEALMHICWLKNQTWTCALPPGITPYECVYGEALVLMELPIWGSLMWILDTSNGKLAARVWEGRWVGFALESNGHRVYCPERKTITVERNVVFSREHLPVVLEEDMFETVIVNKARGSEKATEDPINKPNKHHAENEDEQETSEVAEGLTDVLDEPPTPAEPVQQPPALIPNPTLPVLHCSTRTCNPSRYTRDLTSGEFTTGSHSGSVPRGLQVPKNMEIRPEMEEGVGGTAMAVEMGMGSGLEP